MNRVNFTWKASWIMKVWFGEDPKMVCSKAKEIGLNALIVCNKDINYLKRFSKAGKKYGIETYFSLSFSGYTKKQVMSEEETKKLEEYKNKSKSELLKMNYQSCGKPVNRGEVAREEMVCFHQPEVLEGEKKITKNILENVHGLTGIGFDSPGYQNYHCCYCDHSMKLFKEYRKKHRELSEKEALDRFSLDAKADIVNQLVDYAKSIRGDIKTTGHIYPVFLPEMLHGYRLNIDYCGETCSWKPGWEYSEVCECTKTIMENEGKCFDNQKAVAFISIPTKKRDGYEKSLERIKKEIQQVYNAGCDRIMFCCFSLIENKNICSLLKELFKNGRRS